MRLARSLLILVTCATPAAAQNHMVADPQPQNANAPQRANDIHADYPGQTHGDFAIKDFRFHDGEALSELRLHYFTLGTPHRNKSGQIDNAVLLLHGTGDDASGFLRPTFTANLFKSEQPLDLAKFYVICHDILGHGRSSKPSDGLRTRFPHYDYEDMVVAEYRLITEKLGVAHLRLLLGTSMGGMHAYLWGERYPQMMDAIVAISALPVEIAGRNRLWRAHDHRSNPQRPGMEEWELREPTARLFPHGTTVCHVCPNSGESLRAIPNASCSRRLV